MLCLSLVLSVLAGLVREGSCATLCSQCNIGLTGDSYICPSLENLEYEMSVSDNDDVLDGTIHVRCKYTLKEMNLSLLTGCAFPNVKHVMFQYCPLPNTSFAEVFEKMGIDPLNVEMFRFVSLGLNSNNLEEFHLQGLSNLTNLALTGHNFRSVHENLLIDTPKLSEFTLAENDISTLPVSLFANTPDLTSIQLYYNNIDNLPNGLFENLTKLRNITLAQNKLVNIHPELFANLPALWSLDLKSNRISELHPQVFSGLSGLRRISLDYNRLNELPEDLFHNCTNLLDVDISGNRLQSLPSALFRGQNNLYNIEMNSNLLQELPFDIFEGLSFLGKLKMKRNGLKSLPSNIFVDLTQLEVLDIQSNVLENIPAGCFDNQTKMDILILKNNSLNSFPDGIFKNCKMLEKLYMSHNKLEALQSSWFPAPDTSLQLLDLGNNAISFSIHGTGKEISVEKQFPLINQIYLKDLYLSYNKIDAIPQAIGNLENLITLQLSHNSIDYLDANDLHFKSESVTIDLSGNQIKTINVDGLENIAPYNPVNLTLHNNYLQCDCNLYNFLREVQGTFSRIRVLEKDTVYCNYPNDANLHSILEVDTEQLTCKVPDCNSQCRCFTRPHDQMLIINCSEKSMSEFPKLQLQEQQINNYSITLDLSKNDLVTLDGLQLSNYPSLVSLNLSHNSLSSINASTLPLTLRVLDIRGNNFTHLTQDTVDYLTATDVLLSLGDNPWVCDCKVLQLQQFLRSPGRRINDIHSVFCHNLNETLIDLAEEEFCPIILRPLFMVSMSVIVVFLILFGVLGTISFWKYKDDIKVWLFTHRLCLWAVTHEEYEFNKKYDVFISYSDKDEEFVNSVLVPGLESGEPKYQVCLHYRDWTPGAYIQHQIYQSVQDSRRTIVVLSSNFIENVWGQLEFKTAHCQALKDRHNRIIVIVLGEVPPENELDDELKLYLSTRTYLQFGDAKFWEKLRYAMPHPSATYKHQRKRKDTDKLELV